jgi:hypothetical protein
MADSILKMEEGRLNEKRVDSQADQFAKQIAQQAAIAAGMVNGQPTVEARRADAAIAENDSNRKLREANVTGVYDGKPTVAGRAAESGLQTAELQREAAQALDQPLEIDAARRDVEVAEADHHGGEAEEAGGAAELVADGGHDRLGPRIEQAQHEQVEVRAAQAERLQAGLRFGPWRGGHSRPRRFRPGRCPGRRD